MNTISNRSLTLVRKLNRKKYRQEEGLFLAEGARAVEQILQNGALQVQQLFFDEGQHYWQQQPWSEAAENYRSSTIEADTYAEVSDTDNPQGVMALCRIPEQFDIKEMAAGEGVILAADAVQDPGNMGTIIRTAGWFGIAALISGKGTVDLFHPKVVRSTAGSTGSLPHANADLGEALPVLEREGWQVLLLDASEGSVPLREVRPSGRTVIVIGNEANGISPSLAAGDRQKVRIPSPQNGRAVESLNAAIATSIALYELT